MTMALRGLDSRVRPYAEWAMRIAYHYGIEPTITSTFRDWQKQQQLYDDWRAGRSRWPANRPGDSAHNYGWAFDSVVPDMHQEAWNEIRRYVGFEVLPNDVIHAQVPNWRRYRPDYPHPQVR